MEIETLSLEQLRRLQYQIEDRIAAVKQEPKVLIWRVVTHDCVCDNFAADNYEAAIDLVMSRYKEFAMRECADVVKDQDASGWRDSHNPEIPYLHPALIPEGEYQRDWLPDVKAKRAETGQPEPLIGIDSEGGSHD